MIWSVHRDVSRDYPCMQERLSGNSLASCYTAMRLSVQELVRNCHRTRSLFQTPISSSHTCSWRRKYPIETNSSQNLLRGGSDNAYRTNQSVDCIPKRYIQNLVGPSHQTTLVQRCYHKKGHDFARDEIEGSKSDTQQYEYNVACHRRRSGYMANHAQGIHRLGSLHR